MEMLGIDIGGSGIKGAIVDAPDRRVRQASGCASTRLSPPNLRRLPKSSPRLPPNSTGVPRLGCTFPAIVQHGVTMTAANVDDEWIGTEAKQLFESQTGNAVVVLNDADAAGIAEMKFGAGRGHSGLVVIADAGHRSRQFSVSLTAFWCRILNSAIWSFRRQSRRIPHIGSRPASQRL